jgi:hypothetical protein
MKNRYTISTGYSLDTDRYDARIYFDHKEIAELYLDEDTKKIIIEFNNEFTLKQAYNLSDFVQAMKDAERTFRDYLASGNEPIYPHCGTD